MKACCVCGEPIKYLHKCYPRFQTDPNNPELICLTCLPRELIKTFQELPKEAKEQIMKDLNDVRDTERLH